MSENEISYLIRGAIFKVYNKLGPGLYEAVYILALKHELEKVKLNVKLEVGIPFIYDTQNLDLGYRMDMLVENKVIIEVKSVEHLAEVHHKQVLTYLRLSNLKLVILVNFNVNEINNGIFRKVNNL
ncbi:MAG: GxxExxY protein [Bacteroidota bacterium]